MFDLVIKGGHIVDGTGAPAFDGDVAVTDGRVQEVGHVSGRARRTIEADGLLVTPGFVDIHTHYDGQITWDPLLTPSCWHGVTTIVMGNCGVGFAPVAPDRHEWLIGLMEGVEDIPGAALSAGLQWGWESYPEYLDAIDEVPKAIDVGSQVPHGAVRAYVMGERGARNEPASSDDIEQMAALVRRGLEAGALGFSTSRTLAHRAIDGEPVPGTFAAEDELFGIGRVLGELGVGVFELAPAGAMGEDLDAPDREMAWIVKLAETIRRPVSFVLSQNNVAPTDWRKMLDLARGAHAAGFPVRPQVHARTTSLLLGLQTFHPFNFTDAWSEVGLLPLDEQVARLADPDVRARMIAQVHAMADDPIVGGFMHPDHVFVLGDPPNYEPPADSSIGAKARASGGDPWADLYDALLVDDGRELLNSPVLNYTDGNLDSTYEMLSDPVTAFGLGDGGAHAGQTCDASSTTFLLTHWVRDRQGDRLPLELAVHKMTGATADLYGLGDRGRLVPGKKADVNLIDLDGLQLHRPQLVHDLPGDARRLIQHADGYVATINAGEVTLEHGEDTARGRVGWFEGRAETSSLDRSVTWLDPPASAADAPAPDALALDDLHRTSTRAELAERVARTTHALRDELGLAPDDHVAQLAGNRVELVELCLGALVAGVWITPINWHLAPDEIAYQLDDSGAHVLFVAPEHRELAERAVGDRRLTVIEIGDELDELLARQSDAPPPLDGPPGGNMFYTSGTTGQPKGVKRARQPTVAASLAGLRASGAVLGLDGGGPHLVTGPLYHAAPLGFAVMDLLAGAPLVLTARFDTTEVLDLIASRRVRNSHLVPTMCVRLLALPDDERAAFDPSSLRTVLHGAAPIAESVKRRMIEWWGPVFVEYWGGSEGGVVTLIDSEDWLRHPGSVGRPTPGHEVVADDEGVLWCRKGAGRLFEYHGAPEKTDAAHAADGAYSLGDIGSVDDEGYVYLSDRKSNMIISGGVNIYPAEVEAVLSDHPAVRDVAVFGIPDDEWGESVKGAVELAGGYAASADLERDILAFGAERLAKFKVPRSLDFEDALPRHDTGKLYTRLLKARYWPDD